MSAAEFTFWLCVAILAYTYAGYPLLLLLLSMGRKARLQPDEAWAPLVSVIIPVHNEQENLPEKIRSTLSLEWPDEKLEVIVASDASDDESDSIVARWPDRRVRLVRLHMRGGKALALNAAMAEVKGEVLVFTDASITTSADALRLLVSALGADNVGCASTRDVTAGGGGEGLYTRYDMFVRTLESRCAGAVGMSGSFYAVRRSAWRLFPAHVATDLYSGLCAVAAGYRCIFEPRALAFVRVVPRLDEEFRRKVRTLQTGMAAVWSRRGLLLPRWKGESAGWRIRPYMFALQLWSHKVLRWATPFFMVALLASTLATLPHHPWALGLQFGFYALALLGWVWKAAPARLAAFFCAAQIAAAAAWLRFALGHRIQAWQPSRR
jgi:cellulose synthase/poly-beta-1,6-N-acetylglucosamine synthase-like glycosyltransferase